MDVVKIANKHGWSKVFKSIMTNFDLNLRNDGAWIWKELNISFFWTATLNGINDKKILRKKSTLFEILKRWKKRVGGTRTSISSIWSQPTNRQLLMMDREENFLVVITQNGNYEFSEKVNISVWGWFSRMGTRFVMLLV